MQEAGRPSFVGPTASCSSTPSRPAAVRDLVEACPYGAIFWDEEHGLPQKCTLCAHLLDAGWQRTRCVQACPTGALRVVRLGEEEWADLHERTSLEPLHPEYGTLPSVAYANLGRFTLMRLAGTVVTRTGELEDCFEGATVRLLLGDEEVGRQATGAFGEFAFANLPGELHDYAVEVSAVGYESIVVAPDPSRCGLLPLVRLKEPS